MTSTSLSYASQLNENPEESKITTNTPNLHLNENTRDEEKHDDRSEWFKSFFLQPNAIPKHRMFCIWCGGDRKAYTNDIYIGSSEEESAKWFVAVEDVLSGFKKANLENSTFMFEIAIDQETYNTQQNKFLTLQNTYGDWFKITFIKDLNIPEIQEALIHSEVGNPALASDALRIWHLKNPNYDVNVYMDVDTFLDKASHLERYPDFNVFGREVEKGHVYYNKEKGNNNVVFGQNSNDYLIEKEAEENHIALLKAQALQNFDNNKFLINYYTDRARFIRNENIENGYKEYLQNLEDTVTYFLKDGKLRFYDIHAVIMNTFGPYLWESSKIARVNTVVQDPNPSAGGWREGKTTPMGQYSRTNTLKNLQWFQALNFYKKQPEKAAEFLKNLVKVHFMGLDYVYFSNFSKEEFITPLKQEMTSLWNSLNFPDMKNNQIQQILGISRGMYHAAKILDEQIWAQFFKENKSNS